jgi:hypothetical protein
MKAELLLLPLRGKVGMGVLLIFTKQKRPLLNLPLREDFTARAPLSKQL